MRLKWKLLERKEKENKQRKSQKAGNKTYIKKGEETGEKARWGLALCPGVGAGRYQGQQCATGRPGSSDLFPRTKAPPGQVWLVHNWARAAGTREGVPQTRVDERNALVNLDSKALFRENFLYLSPCIAAQEVSLVSRFYSPFLKILELSVLGTDIPS